MCRRGAHPWPLVPGATQRAAPARTSTPPTPRPAQAQGGDWNRDLLFKVPIDHPEVQRLQGRYKK
jgi:hypothetical protein